MDVLKKVPAATDVSPHFTRRLVAQILLLNLFVYALTAYLLYQNWQENEARVATATQNLARIIERSITGILSTADVALRSAADEAERQLAAGALDKPMLDGYIARQTARVTGLEAIRMANAAGDVIYGRGTAPGSPVNIADRDHFQYVRDHPLAGTYIGKPYVGRLTPTWVFNLARRINHPDGSFAGVAYAVFTVDFFNDFFATIHVEQDGVVVLRYDDMAVVARHPMVASDMGQTSVSPELTALLKAGRSAATYSATAMVDNIRRIYSYQKVPDFPFYIFVGQSVNAVIADWRKEALRLASAVLLFTLVTIILTRQALAKRRGEQQAELNLRAANQELELRVAERTAELRHSEAMLRALLDAIPESAFLMQPDGIVLAANATVAQRLGVTLEQMIGKNIYHLPTPEVAERRRGYVDQVIQTGQPARFEDQRGDRIIDNAVYPVLDAQGRVVQLTVLGIDITERKQAELALYESEERLRLANRATRDVIWDWDIVNDSQRWNAAGTVALGWRDIVEAPQPAAWWIERVHPEDRQRVDAGFFAVVTDPAQNYWYDEYRFRRLDGSYAQIIDRGYVLRNAQGEAVRMIGAMLDITERKQVEEALRRNHAMLARTEGIAHLGSWEWDVATDTVTWSDELFRIFQRNLTDGAPSFAEHPELYYPEDTQRLMEAVEAAVSNGTPYEIELRAIRKDGATRVCLARGHAEIGPEKRATRLFGSVQDITERRRAEESLRTSEERFRAAFMTGADAHVISTVDDGTLVEVNDGFVALFGYSREEALGKTSTELHLYHDPDVRTALVSQLKESGQVKDFQTPGQKKNGEIVPISLSFSIIQLNGKPHIYGVLRDITEHKRAEEALRKAHDDLARSNTDLERFAYVASHDLQEPLRMVASFVQLLAERYRGQLDSDADEFIAFAVDGAKRMQTLINDLLEYSRVGTRGEPLQPTDANVALDDALWNLDLAVTDAGATITHDPLPTVIADPTQLAQLFQNLVSNAIKFHGTEPPVVHIAARQTFEVSETSKVSKQVWEFAVRDNGIGIAPADHERIFGIFQRLHSREEYAGTGIGLAVCQRIVERHGGKIWVESQLGQGTTFYFTLPPG